MNRVGIEVAHILGVCVVADDTGTGVIAITRRQLDELLAASDDARTALLVGWRAESERFKRGTG